MSRLVRRHARRVGRDLNRTCYLRFQSVNITLYSIWLSPQYVQPYNRPTTLTRKRKIRSVRDVVGVIGSWYESGLGQVLKYLVKTFRGLLTTEDKVFPLYRSFPIRR